MSKNLVIISGPTASGKTDVSIQLAQELGCPVVSADSRQIYKEMTVGTAVPSKEQLELVPHYLVQSHSIHEDFDVSMYETEALGIIGDIHAENDNALLCGGSGLYIDAVCKGFDELPQSEPALRQELEASWKEQGIRWLQDQLAGADPEFFKQVDKQNPVRMIRALEVIRISGKPFSELRKGLSAQRPFQIHKYLLVLPREELFARIDTRVDLMMEQGLREEAAILYPFRHLKALKTVGYRELFDHIDGKCSLDEAVAKIKVNTRRYAKRQMTWFQRDPEYRSIEEAERDSLLSIIQKDIAHSGQ